MHPITFPNLGLEFNISPIAFTIFGKEIYWYGIIIAIAIFVAIIMGKKDSIKYDIKWDDVLDFLFIAIIVGIITARIYYVIFSWDYYSRHPEDIIKIWNGGIAIYGGLIGGLITAIIYCRIKKINFLKLCDLISPYFALTQSIGRWGNFINQEAYGIETNSFLKMGIYNEGLEKYIYVHPTFLYESILTFFIFLFLYCISRKKRKDGEIFYLYMILYGIGRAIIESFRIDSLFLYDFRISQVIAVIFVVVFSGLLINIKNKEKSLDKNI